MEYKLRRIIDGEVIECDLSGPVKLGDKELDLAGDITIDENGRWTIPLKTGENLVLDGLWPVSLRYDFGSSVDTTDTTIVGSNKIWKSEEK